MIQRLSNDDDVSFWGGGEIDCTASIPSMRSREECVCVCKGLLQGSSGCFQPACGGLIVFFCFHKLSRGIELSLFVFVCWTRMVARHRRLPSGLDEWQP